MKKAKCMACMKIIEFHENDTSVLVEHIEKQHSASQVAKLLSAKSRSATVNYLDDFFNTLEDKIMNFKDLKMSSSYNPKCPKIQKQETEFGSESSSNPSRKEIYDIFLAMSGSPKRRSISKTSSKSCPNLSSSFIKESQDSGFGALKRKPFPKAQRNIFKVEIHEEENKKGEPKRSFYLNPNFHEDLKKRFLTEMASQKGITQNKDFKVSSTRDKEKPKIIPYVSDSKWNPQDPIHCKHCRKDNKPILKRQRKQLPKFASFMWCWPLWPCGVQMLNYQVKVCCANCGRIYGTFDSRTAALTKMQ